MGKGTSRLAYIAVSRIEASHLLITILDPCTFDSTWVRAENAWAEQAGIPILAMFDSDRYRWDDVSHWKTDFPHVFKYQVVPYTKDYRSESRDCLLYTSPSPRDATLSRMPSSA